MPPLAASTLCALCTLFPIFATNPAIAWQRLEAFREGEPVTQKIRGVTFEENLNNAMGLEFYNLSHRFGYQSPNWPYFEDVKIERIHYMAKSGVLSQRITTSMHNTTHIG